jgi:hypothetical protein
MATDESRKRMERWEAQRARERWEASPEYGALMRMIRQRTQRERRRRWPYAPPVVVTMFCMWEGFKGGRPPAARRCQRRLHTRYCWNWRQPGSTRCWRHQPKEPPAHVPTDHES